MIKSERHGRGARGGRKRGKKGLLGTEMIQIILHEFMGVSK